MRLLDFLTGTRRPDPGTAICSPDELRRRLLGLNRPTSPWRVIEPSADEAELVAEWKIVDAEWYEIFAKAGLQRIFTLALRLDPSRREVRAQDQEFQITWEAGVPTLSRSTRAARGQTWSFAAGTAFGFTETLGLGQMYRYRFATSEIKEPVRETVTGCGWTYKGVVLGTL